MEKQEAVSPGTRIAGWIQRNRIVLLILGGVVLAILIGSAIYGVVQSSRLETADQILQQFEEDYNSWVSADEGEKSAAAEKVKQNFAEVEEEAQGTWAHQRSLFLMGDFFYTQEEWQDAESSYANLADSYPKSYLAPVSLFNSAAAGEERGDQEKALEYYNRIFDDYSSSPLAARALFSAGRITENEAAAGAITIYNRLIESYPQSSWTKLARSRIIELQIGQ